MFGDIGGAELILFVRVVGKNADLIANAGAAQMRHANARRVSGKLGNSEIILDHIDLVIDVSLILTFEAEYNHSRSLIEFGRPSVVACVPREIAEFADTDRQVPLRRRAPRVGRRKTFEYPHTRLKPRPRPR